MTLPCMKTLLVITALLLELPCEEVTTEEAVTEVIHNNTAVLTTVSPPASVSTPGTEEAVTEVTHNNTAVLTTVSPPASVSTPGTGDLRKIGPRHNVAIYVGAAIGGMMLIMIIIMTVVAVRKHHINTSKVIENKYVSRLGIRAYQ